MEEVAHSRTIFLSAIAIGTIFLGSIIMNVNPQTQRPICQSVLSQICVQTYTYLVSINATGIYAKNGTSGQLSYNATNTAIGVWTVLSAVIGSTTKSGGQVYIKAGIYSYSQPISIGDSRNWGLTFEQGSILNYHGNGFAMQVIASTRGNIQFFSIRNLYINSSSGGLQINGAYLSELVNLHIESKGNNVALDLDNLNTFQVYGGTSYIHGDGTLGSVGVREGYTGETNDVHLNIPQVATFTDGYQIGNPSFTTGNQGDSINGYVTTAVNGVHIFSAGQLIMTLFTEVNTANDILIDNPSGLRNVPTTITLAAGTAFSSNPATTNSIKVTGYCNQLTVQAGANIGGEPIILSPGTNGANLALGIQKPPYTQVTLNGATNVVIT